MRLIKFKIILETSYHEFCKKFYKPVLATSRQLYVIRKFSYFFLKLSAQSTLN
jgi:hypothetical protein